SAGKPINQRLKAGFNTPRLSVGAGDPDCIVPRACLSKWTFPPPLVAVVLSPVPSLALGVAQPACVFRAGPPVRFGGICGPVPSLERGVAHPAICASRFRSAHPCFVPCLAFCPFPLGLPSCACRVVHPLGDKPKPLPDVRRADARSRQIGIGSASRRGGESIS